MILAELLPFVENRFRAVSQVLLFGFPYNVVKSFSTKGTCAYYGQVQVQWFWAELQPVSDFTIFMAISQEPVFWFQQNFEELK